MKTPHYWEVRARKYPDKLVLAQSEREAKELSGYRGCIGHNAYAVLCQAHCHEYVVNDRGRSYAEVKGPMEQLVCRRCDEYLRKDDGARIQGLEKAVVELRDEVRSLWEGGNE